MAGICFDILISSFPQGEFTLLARSALILGVCFAKTTDLVELCLDNRYLMGFVEAD